MFLYTVPVYHSVLQSGARVDVLLHTASVRASSKEEAASAVLSWAQKRDHRTVFVIHGEIVMDRNLQSASMALGYPGA